MAQGAIRPPVASRCVTAPRIRNKTMQRLEAKKGLAAACVADPGA